ncbi:MAG: hypothetical protein IT384_08630 [Deltaproteobacteria bacterium]|nr:hypothetical protein [Deltaproteobacteria bacterium]
MKSWYASPLILLLPLAAAAQEGEPLQDIQVGSSRIGGPGLTAAERRANEDVADEPELTEETLPAKGHPKRVPGLHKIAARYARGQMWKDACDRFDQIMEEAGDEGMRSQPDAAAYAARSYFQCAEIEFRNHKYDKTEALLKKSEQYGPSDYRHSGVRRQMLRDSYREEVGKGNISKALEIFRKYQSEKADEDERIWIGEQLAERAWSAYRDKDEAALERALADADAVAPMNSELRRLKDRIHTEKTVLGNVAMFTIAGALVALALMQIYRWRARARIAALADGDMAIKSGKRNKFLDDED